VSARSGNIDLRATAADERFPRLTDANELHRQLRTERIEEHIQRTVDAAPPLTPEQRDRLTAILRKA
jgi:hypothetical protein